MEATYGFAEANNDDELKFDYAQFGEITGLLSIALPWLENRAVCAGAFLMRFHREEES
jgi:hypothetical protein